MIATNFPPPVADGLCCPTCRSGLVPDDAVARCGACGRAADVLTEGFFNFLSGSSPNTRAILDWPLEFTRGLDAWVRGGGGSATLGAGFQEDLVRHGLVRPDGALTPLGANIQYHLSEFKWQAGRKGFDGVFDLGLVGPSVRALDVGCGAAQTLRQLEPDRPVELFGVDVDLDALALGRKFAELQGFPIVLAGASAYDLPFRDGFFDLVISRVALNYTHQRTALAEMVRVLRPGGYLFCRVERAWHDVVLFRKVRGLRTALCRARDFAYGVANAAVGWQPVPGSLLRGGRAFATAHRLGAFLRAQNCRVVLATESPNGTSVFGRKAQLIVTAQKS